MQDMEALNQVQDKINKSFHNPKKSSIISSSKSSKVHSRRTSGNVTSGLFTTSEDPCDRSINDSEIDAKFQKRFDKFIANLEEENIKDLALHRQTESREIQNRMQEMMNSANNQ